MDIDFVRLIDRERHENLLAEADYTREMRVSTSETTDREASKHSLGSWLYSQLARIRRASAPRAA